MSVASSEEQARSKSLHLHGSKSYDASGDFSTIRQTDGLYIDKTSHIAEFMDRASAYHLLKRPRRCGKSTFLSTMRDFLSSDPTTLKERRHYFEGLDIREKPEYKAIWDEHFGRYPVLDLNLSVRCLESSSLLQLIPEVDAVG